MADLAIFGGRKARERPFPTVSDSSGRDLGEEEKELLMEVIDSGHLNRVGGTKVPQFEAEFAEKYGVHYATASTSGTAAIHVALGALNLDPGDEVITTPITDMGTVIAVLLCNCIPIFADVDPLTCNLLPEEIERRITPRTRAIIAVHLFGQPCDMNPIVDIARRHKLYLIEDCAQAHLAEYRGRKVGTIGDMGCFSLQQSKQITAGDGGITITNNEKLAERAKLFADKAWPREGGARGHLFLAPNYRMTELQGAVGLAQLRKADGIVERRRKSADYLTQLIRKIPGIKPPKIIDGVKHSWWMYSFTIEEELLGVSPPKFQEALNAEGIPFHVGYIPNPIFSYPVLRDKRTYGSSHCPFDCPRGRDVEYREEEYPNTLRALEKVFVMSWNEGMAEGDVEDIARGLQKVAEHYRSRA
ncbi:MAG: DegT/DnrJ/EryC1/StrS family aminotransferase [bacterium]